MLRNLFKHDIIQETFAYIGTWSVNKPEVITHASQGTPKYSLLSRIEN